MESVKMGLLDILVAKSGCMYLSDLAVGKVLLLPHYLRELDADAFSLREWEDAVSYLTGKNIPFETPEEAKQYLIGCIPKKCAKISERNERI